MKLRYASQRTGLYIFFRLGAILGQGKSGRVQRVLDGRGRKTSFVCKIIDTTALHPDQVKLGMSPRDKLLATLNEIQLLKRRGWLEGYTRDGNIFYIIMKKIKGTTVSFCDKSQKQACFNALRDCHRHNIAQGDIQESNFLFNRKNHKVTAIDFGQSHDGTLINILIDLLVFVDRRNRKNNLARTTKTLRFLGRDFVNVCSQHKVQAFLFLTWWCVVFYGAFFGYPFLHIHQFCGEYLRAKLYHFLFLELHSVFFMKHNILAGVLNFFMKEASSLKLSHALKQFFKCLKPLLLFIPAWQLQTFYQTYSDKIKMVFSFCMRNPVNTHSIQEGFSSFSLPAVWQAALLYYPFQEMGQIVKDMLSAVEPESLTKVTADLYFQYHPGLYVKAAFHKLNQTPEKRITPEELLQGIRALQNKNA